ncbi:MAG TPA: 50S ribosomal protein L22 [Candidatus Nanoarchaeia archaeon]|nr:50S ribosomal protein L22 [Candidatus Nanoarchaeia archaeon]
MSSLRYSHQNFDSKAMVRVAGRNLPIPHKASYEIAKFIKHRRVEWAIKNLELVQQNKVAVPFRRYNSDVTHKPGMAAGRYPRNASIYLVKLLKNLRGAAKSKGLNTENLVIIHATATKGPARRRYGRKMGFERKNTHVELVARESESLKSKPAQVKQPMMKTKSNEGLSLKAAEVKAAPMLRDNKAQEGKK